MPRFGERIYAMLPLAELAKPTPPSPRARGEAAFPEDGVGGQLPRLPTNNTKAARWGTQRPSAVRGLNRVAS